MADNLLLLSVVDIHQEKSVSDKLPFNFFVERRVSGKAGGVVDFKQDRLAVFHE